VFRNESEHFAPTFFSRRSGWFVRHVVLLHLNQQHPFAARALAMGLPLKEEFRDDNKRMQHILSELGSSSQGWQK
jgi:hypothetical protein